MNRFLFFAILTALVLTYSCTSPEAPAIRSKAFAQDTLPFSEVSASSISKNEPKSDTINGLQIKMVYINNRRIYEAVYRIMGPSFSWPQKTGEKSYTVRHGKTLFHFTDIGNGLKAFPDVVPDSIFIGDKQFLFTLSNDTLWLYTTNFPNQHRGQCTISVGSPADDLFNCFPHDQHYSYRYIQRSSKRVFSMFMASPNDMLGEFDIDLETQGKYISSIGLFAHADIRCSDDE